MAADYRDIYNYTGYDTGSGGPQYQGDPEKMGYGTWIANDISGNPMNIATTYKDVGSGSEGGYIQVPDTPDMSNAPGFADNGKMNGIVSLIDNSKLYNQDGSGNNPYTYDVDYSKLPQTKFGPVTNTWAVTNMNDVENPDLVYDDPNYGKITAKSNMKQTGWDKFNTVAPGLIMSGATMGLGALGFPAFAMAGVNSLRGASESGNWGQALANTGLSLAGNLMGGVGLGLPPEITNALTIGQKIYGGVKTADQLYNLYKNMKDS